MKIKKEVNYVLSLDRDELNLLFEGLERLSNEYRENELDSLLEQTEDMKLMLYEALNA